MYEMRMLVARHGGAHDVSRWKDDLVLERMARQISLGQWHICPHPDGQAAEAQPADSAAPVASQAVVVPRKQVQPESPRPAIVEDTSSFPQDADLLAIAEAQREAALLGIPFCEECEKARLASSQRGGNQSGA
jgi:hypothetical protein